MKKKLLLVALASIATSSMASGLGMPTFVIDSCDEGVGINNCKMRNINEAGSNYPSKGNGPSAIDLATAGIAAGGAGIAALLAEDKVSNLMKPVNIQGSYNSRVPGGNPFVFCSGGRPSRKNPLRPVYDMICPAGNVSPEQVAQKNGLTNHMSDAKSLTSNLLTIGTASLVGIGLSEAAKKTLGGTQDSKGNSVSVGNNMSFNEYNRQMYRQIQHENYLRQQEEWKAAQNPEYVKKIIPDSNAFRPDQSALNGQKQVFDNLLKDTQENLKNLNSLANTPALSAEQIQRQYGGVSAASVQNVQSVQRNVNTVPNVQNTQGAGFAGAFR